MERNQCGRGSEVLGLFQFRETEVQLQMADSEKGRF